MIKVIPLGDLPLMRVVQERERGEEDRESERGRGKNDKWMALILHSYRAKDGGSVWTWYED